MLDTIVLALESHNFKIAYPERFNPPAHGITQKIMGSNGNMKFMYNPSKKEQENGYLPRITIYKRYFAQGGCVITMKIEFSAPKICYGQNFSELRESQFEIVLVTLHRRLENMGIIIAIDVLRHARVMAIHYSKNMMLESGSYCRMIINELSKLDLNKRLDMMQTDYKNGGEAIKYHSSYYSIIFYDKIKDLEQAGFYGEKRAIENDYGTQLDLLKTLPPRQEVLRLEVRLSSRKMNTLFPKLRIAAPLRFDSLFKRDISRVVLLYHWQEITEGLYILAFDGESIGNLIAHIQAVYPRITGKALCEMLGMIKASNELGIRGARLAMHMSSSQWYRIKRKLKEISGTRKNHRFVAVNQIQREIEQFVPLQWPHFKDVSYD